MYEPNDLIKQSSFPMKIVNFKWERVQLFITLSIPKKDIQDLEYYLYHPITEKKVYFSHIEYVGDLIELRINMMNSWEDHSPVPSGRWLLFAQKRGSDTINIATTCPSLIDFETVERDKNMNHFHKVFSASKTQFYSVRPIANDENAVLYISIHFKRIIQKTKREIAREKRRKKRREQILEVRKQVFSAIYTLSKKMIGITENRILFTSDSRAVLGGNMEFVYNRMIDRDLKKDFDIKMLFKKNITDRRNFLDKLKLPYYLATSKTILVDDFHPLLYNLDFDKSQNIIQLWHASGPFKTVGYSRIGKPGGPSINGKSHKIYTSAIVGSEHSTPFYAEAFGMHEEDVYPTGIPRIDSFFDEGYKASIRNQMYEEFPQMKTADKVILFAPTFRGSGPKTAYYPMHQIDFDKLAKYAKENNAVVVFKLHPFVRDNVVIPDHYKDLFLDAFKYREINDLLLVSDLLITDYSSVVFEYSLLNKPMIFYGFDVYDYISSRDFYEGFGNFVPGKIVRTFNELMNAIEKEDYDIEKIAVFRDKYFKYQDANSSDRVIDWLILDNFPKEISRGQKQKLLNDNKKE
ncbi:CDP-glycerol glycerophosphotransferase family protein [Paenisporosarcina antarctica]|uniref:CDP-glycerol glycerophosphotransferase family protein n=1 Tax=Paenisporosarcina antarctica TaxID=417367 RepID=A0A4P6ZZL8_9BACL|nr:CDP-glycerol glycerophosphotransferase family protein [Paenisporosarcina antarctica]QBP41942.1 CDP-glycerol glycerophosphotransferase family protein [Paenisporosarcina antarctica]